MFGDGECADNSYEKAPYGTVVLHIQQQKAVETADAATAAWDRMTYSDSD